MMDTLQGEKRDIHPMGYVYSLAVLMETHKQARGMWNELLAAGFADKDLKMPNHDANLAAIERARLAIARCSKEGGDK